MTSDTYRILTPSEFTALIKAVPKEKHEILVDTLMFTGMRYEECLAFAENVRICLYPQNKHRGWFDAKNHCITLPASFTKTLRDRVVHLTPAFSERLEKYLKRHKEGLPFPARKNMNENLTRWWETCICSICEWPNACHTSGNDVFPCDAPTMEWRPTVKTFRKSWESWLLQADYSIHKVAMSQGHTVAVSEHHYANLSPLLKSENDKVKELTQGWGT